MESEKKTARAERETANEEETKEAGFVCACQHTHLHSDGNTEQTILLEAA